MPCKPHFIEIEPVTPKTGASLVSKSQDLLLRRAINKPQKGRLSSFRQNLLTSVRPKQGARGIFPAVLSMSSCALQTKTLWIALARPCVGCVLLRHYQQPPHDDIPDHSPTDLCTRNMHHVRHFGRHRRERRALRLEARASERDKKDRTTERETERKSPRETVRPRPTSQNM